MNVIKKIVFGAIIAGTVHSANAELIQSDFLVEGDKYAVLDTEQNITWLSNTLTMGQSYNQVMARINGGDLDGWRVPTVSELYTMMSESFSKDINFYSPVWVYQASTNEEAKVFRNLFFSGNSSGYQYGLFEYNSKISLTGNSGDSVAGLNFVNGRYEELRYSARQDSGVWLVSDTSDGLSLAKDVPVPAVAIMSMLGLLFTRRKKA